MSIRLQVVLDREEAAEIRRIAKARRQTVSDWVRQSLRAARREYPTADAGRKVQVVREAVGHCYPSADIDTMLSEIEAGCTGRREA